MKIMILASTLLFISACSSTPKEPVKVQIKPPATIEEAVAAEYRTPEMRVRDTYRHPVETLNFFGLEPQMTVVEVSPANGWYTQIIAPLLNSSGQYIAAAVPSSLNEHIKEMNNQRTLWMAAHADLTSKAQTVEFSPAIQDIAAPDSADMVLTFRNVHNWMRDGGEVAAFKSFYKVLKPGGTLGVVEHRANPKQKRDPKSGYVREQDVIQMAKKAGFQLVAQSEINANPKDTKNYPEGVWTLPPSLKLKDKDREKYLAIGESDRMTLKFVKPAAKK